MVMRLPDEKLIELRNKIESCLACTKISLRDLQSLIGTLNFACQVIVPGRAFCLRLIDATCNVRRSHHKIRATLAMKDDLRVWLSFLSNYNGTTVILDQLWSSNYELNLFSTVLVGSGKVLVSVMTENGLRHVGLTHGFHLGF